MLCCLGEQDTNLGVNKSRKAGFILTNTPGAVTAGMHGGALAMRNCYYTCSTLLSTTQEAHHSTFGRMLKVWRAVKRAQPIKVRLTTKRQCGICLSL